MNQSAVYCSSPSLQQPEQNAARAILSAVSNADRSNPHRDSSFTTMSGKRCGKLLRRTYSTSLTMDWAANDFALLAFRCDALSFGCLIPKLVKTCGVVTLCYKTHRGLLVVMLMLVRVIARAKQECETAAECS